MIKTMYNILTFTFYNIINFMKCVKLALESYNNCPKTSQQIQLELIGHCRTFYLLIWYRYLDKIINYISKLLQLT